MFVLLELEIYAQVAAPGLIKVGTQDNPATIFWKKQGIYWASAGVESTSSVEYEKVPLNNYKYKASMLINSIGINTEILAFEISLMTQKFELTQ